MVNESLGVGGRNLPLRGQYSLRVSLRPSTSSELAATCSDFSIPPRKARKGFARRKLPTKIWVSAGGIEPPTLGL